jgi:hypothetical protein
VLEPAKTLGRGPFFRERHRQDRRCGAALPAAVKSELCAFSEGLQHVFRRRPPDTADAHSSAATLYWERPSTPRSVTPIDLP